MSHRSFTLPDPEIQSEFYADVPFKRFLAWIVDTVLIVVLCVLILPLTAFTGIFFFGFLFTVFFFVFFFTTFFFFGFFFTTFFLGFFFLAGFFRLTGFFLFAGFFFGFFFKSCNAIGFFAYQFVP